MNCWKTGCHRPADIELVLACYFDDHVFVPRCSEHWGGLSEASCEMHFFWEQANAELVTRRLVDGC